MGEEQRAGGSAQHARGREIQSTLRSREHRDVTAQLQPVVLSNGSRSFAGLRGRPIAQGTECPTGGCSIVALATGNQEEGAMDGIIYLVGLIVVVMAILSFLGLR